MKFLVVHDSPTMSGILVNSPQPVGYVDLV